MKSFNVQEADTSSPHRYPDPAGGEEPHPKAGRPDPDNPGEVFPPTRPKTLGRLFGRLQEGGPKRMLPEHLEAAMREASTFLEGETLEALEAEHEDRLASIRARKAEMQGG